MVEQICGGKGERNAQRYLSLSIKIWQVQQYCQ